ncbi:MAG TPA: hypothetical protein VK094_00450 [Pseudogracilibacillus sp.]|nr:hypothetical protein [Pseudogracilibacillus sp.]
MSDFPNQKVKISHGHIVAKDNSVVVHNPKESKITWNVDEYKLKNIDIESGELILIKKGDGKCG